MKKLEKLEHEVASLTPEEAAEFRAWYFEHDWRNWDHQLQRDVEAGKLDALAQEAAEDYEAGRTSQL